MNAQAAPIEEGFINRNEAAKLLGVSPRTLTSWRYRRDDGGPPSYRIESNVYLYKASELLAWMEQFKVTNGVRVAPPKPGQQPRPWE